MMRKKGQWNVIAVLFLLLAGCVSPGPAFPPDPHPQVFFDKPFAADTGRLSISLSETHSLTGVFQYASFENYSFVLLVKETGMRLASGAIKLSDEPREGQHVHFTLTLPTDTIKGEYLLQIHTAALEQILASEALPPRWVFTLTVF
jgi:hypothetical protein